jgi:hypothetical protein
LNPALGRGPRTAGREALPRQGNESVFCVLLRVIAVLYLLPDGIAKIAVAADITEVREERGGGDQKAYGEKPALRALLMASHLPEAERHNEGGERGQDGERSEPAAVESGRGPHEPHGSGGDDQRENAGSQQTSGKLGTIQRRALGRFHEYGKSEWTVYIVQRDISFNAGLILSVAAVAR